MTARGSASDMVARAGPPLRARLEAAGATLELDLGAAVNLEAPHLESPLRTVLLVLAAHADAPRPFVVRTRDLAGGDAEIQVEGLRLPAGFPDGSPNRDLWDIAFRFLERHHRARIAHSGDRVLMLLPHGARAEASRDRPAREARSSW